MPDHDHLNVGCPTMVGRLERVLLSDPRNAFESQQKIDKQWQDLNYLSRPDYHQTILEFDALREIFEGRGIRIELIENNPDNSLDAIYVRDSSLITPSEEAVLCRMGKDQRSAEVASAALFYRTNNIPIAGTIEAPGTLEGGDVVFLDPRTIVVGRSYRTNQSGIEQLRSILSSTVDRFITVSMPHFRGPSDVLHLMSMISPLRQNTLLVHRPLIPVDFLEWLASQEYQLIDIEPSEYDSLACNVLALDEGTCIMTEGNPATRSRIERAGIKVIEFGATNLCLKGSGGPTCLTRPLYRTPDRLPDRLAGSN